MSNISAAANAQKNQIEHPSTLTKSYAITIPYQTFIDWANANRDSKLVKGFRPGHAPLSYFRNDWLLAAARLISDEIVEQEKFASIFDIKYIVENFQLGQDIKFALHIDLYPEVPKIEFSKIKLTKHVAKVTSEDIENSIAKFAASNFKPMDLETPRKSQMGDFVNVSSIIQDKNGSRERMNDMSIRLGSNTFLKEIEEKLVGLDADAVLTHNFEIPANGTSLQDKNLMGQTVSITFKINKVQGARPFDQKDLFNHFAVIKQSELERKFQLNLEKEAETYSNYLLKESLKKELLKYEFEIPFNMLQDTYRSFRSKVLNDLEYKEGMNLEELVKEKMDLSLEHFENQTFLFAESIARINFLFGHYAQEFNIQVSNSEMDDMVASHKHLFPNGLNDAIKFFAENPDAKITLRDKLSEEKVANAIFSRCNVSIKEHSLSDFYKITPRNNEENEENEKNNKIQNKNESKPNKTEAEAKSKNKTNVAGKQKEKV